jgi:hemerythrin-like metal-binding protein
MVSLTRSAPPSVNVRFIDDQHAVLIEKIERLEEAMAAGVGWAALPQIIRDVKESAAHHCPIEEVLMESYGYPLRDMHALEHRKFFIRLEEMERIAAEGHPAAALQMLSRLRAWLGSHQTGWDAKLGEFLNSRGVA